MSRGAGRLAAPLLVVAALGLPACGYTIGGRALPEDVRTIAVPVFTNRTSEPAVEGLITSAVTEAFSTDGRLRVVGRAEADVVLEGDVVGYRVDSVAFDARTNVQRYRVVVRLNLRLRDARRDRVLFEEPGVEDRADFRVEGTAARTIGVEEGALRVAVLEVARSVVSLTLQRF